MIPHIPNIYTGSISQMPNMGVTLQSVPYHSPFTMLVPTCPPKGKMTGETPEVRSDKRKPREKKERKERKRERKQREQGQKREKKKERERKKKERKKE